VRELRSKLGLALESLDQGGLVHQVLVHHLERDEALELGMARAIDHAHRTRANLGFHDVTLEHDRADG